jgi:hypothetical protein
MFTYIGVFVAGFFLFPLVVLFGTFFFFLHLELAERRLAKRAKVETMKETLRYKTNEGQA